MHRDLKLSNILLTEAGQVKIIDFGLAVQLSDLTEERETLCGTPNYISPEVILNTFRNHKPVPNDFLSKSIFFSSSIEYLIDFEHFASIGVIKTSTKTESTHEHLVRVSSSVEYYSICKNRLLEHPV